VQSLPDPGPGPGPVLEPPDHDGRELVVTRDGDSAHPGWQQHLVPEGPQDGELGCALAVGLGRDPAGTGPAPPESPPGGEIGDSAQDGPLGVEEGQEVSARGEERLGRGIVELHPGRAATEWLETEREPPAERRRRGAYIARLGEVGGERLAAA